MQMRKLFGAAFECPSARTLFSTFIAASINNAIATSIEREFERVISSADEKCNSIVASRDIRERHLPFGYHSDETDCLGGIDTCVTHTKTVNSAVNSALSLLYGEAEAEDLK